MFTQCVKREICSFALLLFSHFIQEIEHNEYTEIILKPLLV
jgi:hypothetical protein